MSLNPYSLIADDIGSLRAQIADLQAELKTAEGVLKKRGDGVYEGNEYRCTVSSTERTTVDWKKVAAKLEPSSQLVTAHTKHTPVTKLTCSARLKEAA